MRQCKAPFQQKTWCCPWQVKDQIGQKVGYVTREAVDLKSD